VAESRHTPPTEAVFLRPDKGNTMQKDQPSSVLTPKEMQRLALIHVQAYVGACHCQSRSDVLLALYHWQSVGGDIADLIRNTRLVIINEPEGIPF